MGWEVKKRGELTRGKIGRLRGTLTEIKCERGELTWGWKIGGGGGGREKLTRGGETNEVGRGELARRVKIER